MRHNCLRCERLLERGRFKFMEFRYGRSHRRQTNLTAPSAVRESFHNMSEAYDAPRLRNGSSNLEPP